MIRLLSALLALLLAVNQASAAIVQVTTKDAAGVTRSFNVTTTTDITGNLTPNQVVCDKTTPTNCAGVVAGNTTVSTDLALEVAIVNLNSNGQNTMANSAPVTIASNQSAVPVTLTSTTLTGTSAVNEAQINGVTPLMGNGATGTGSQRVTIASDNTAFAVNSTLSAETTKVIGTARILGNAGAIVDAATGAAAPANALYQGVLGSGATGGQVAGLVSCDKHVFKHITSATDTLAVQGVASQTIRICSWRSRAAGVATWFLENTASANANCSSSNTQITGVATEAANTGETWGANFWSGLSNTAGNGLCINSTGTGGVDVDVWYAQF